MSSIIIFTTTQVITKSSIASGHQTSTTMKSKPSYQVIHLT